MPWPENQAVDQAHSTPDQGMFDFSLLFLFVVKILKKN